jgi:hypothetical protein
MVSDDVWHRDVVCRHEEVKDHFPGFYVRGDRELSLGGVKSLMLASR